MGHLLDKIVQKPVNEDDMYRRLMADVRANCMIECRAEVQAEIKASQAETAAAQAETVRAEVERDSAMATHEGLEKENEKLTIRDKQLKKAFALEQDTFDKKSEKIEASVQGLKKERKEERQTIKTLELEVANLKGQLMIPPTPILQETVIPEFNIEVTERNSTDKVKKIKLTPVRLQ